MTVQLEQLVTSARQQFEEGNRFTCEHFYQLVLDHTKELISPVHRLARGEACMFFARWAIHDGKLGTGCDWYFEAVTADPLAAEYRIEMVRKALLPMTMFRDAQIEAERATKIDPDNPDAWRLLGQVEHAMGNAKPSAAAYRRQLELAPDSDIAALDMATILIDTQQYADAERVVRRVLHGRYGADALHAMGMIKARLNDHVEAISFYHQAVERKCQDANLATWNLSISEMAIGRYKDGWAHHEARGTQQTDASMRRVMNRFRVPMWKGEAAPARLHVHQEMGHGDTIAMARYLPLLVERGYDVRLEVAPGTVDLMRHSLPGVTVMPKSIDYPGALGIPAFDYHIPMLSLPALFGTDIDTVPWTGPYLHADPASVKPMREALGSGGIGLCWSSGIRESGVWMTEYGRRKSLPAVLVADLVSEPINWVSLQAGPEWACGDMPIARPLPQNPSWADTAAVIASLDLVITVDTAVAHLAGAMGKPVWVLVADHAASWHWMRDRLDSPWYPSARLFRQRPGDHGWSDVVGRAILEFAAVAA